MVVHSDPHLRFALCLWEDTEILPYNLCIARASVLGAKKTARVSVRFKNISSLGYTAGFGTLHFCRLPDFTGPVPQSLLISGYSISIGYYSTETTVVNIFRYKIQIQNQAISSSAQSHESECVTLSSTSARLPLLKRSTVPTR